MRSRHVQLLLLCTVIGCATPRDGTVVVTRGEYTDIQRGPRAELCEPMNAAGALIEEERLVEAEALVDSMIENFDALISTDTEVLVSVANEHQFEQLLATLPEVPRLVPVDWCYREVLHWKAFLRVGLGDYAGALTALEREATVAPTSAAPYVEGGYILNRMGEFAAAKDSYERALAVTEKYPPSAPQKPLALRGLGYSLVELGDLDSAEEAYAESLELDPGNVLAIQELKYIQSIRIQNRQY